jgi:hypothetical protein
MVACRSWQATRRPRGPTNDTLPLNWTFEPDKQLSSRCVPRQPLGSSRTVRFRTAAFAPIRSVMAPHVLQSETVRCSKDGAASGTRNPTLTAATIPPIRVQACNSAPVRAGGDYLLYWMIATRRLSWNFALLLIPAGMGSQNPCQARKRPPAPHILSRRTRRAHGRSAVERGSESAPARRPHSQLSAHALGQENSRMDAFAARSSPHPDRTEQPLRARRSRPELLQGHFLVFGKTDRPWGSERPVFGTVRYMSPANTARKLRVKKYLGRYGVDGRSGR